MGFAVGLSGLDAAQKDLDVTGNNIANASTVGFKDARAQFADVFASSLAGAGAGQIGVGTQLSSVAQQFTQGNITTTNNALDIAINGQGFFRMDDNGAIRFTRNGEFRFDDQGFIVNDRGLKLTGFGVNAAGNIVPAAPTPIQISFADIAPKTTTQFQLGMNFDSRQTPPATALFDPTDPTSFNFSTAGDVFDTLGNSHVFTTYFVKTATAGQWQMYATVDGVTPSTVNLGGGAGVPATLNFNNVGALTTAMPLTASMPVATGAVTPLVFTTDLTGSTQFGSAFGVNNLTQDGFASGHLAGFNISSDGTIVGSYTNGQNRTLGQVVLASFRNPQGLAALGNNLFSETGDSGLPIVGAPGTGAEGVLQSSALEDSNVDLTQELVNLITAQRVYQANAQTIKTQDTVLQTLVNLQ
jgi:flagellar hook protein FlgE